MGDAAACPGCLTKQGAGHQSLLDSSKVRSTENVCTSLSDDVSPNEVEGTPHRPVTRQLVVREAIPIIYVPRACSKDRAAGGAFGGREVDAVWPSLGAPQVQKFGTRFERLTR